MNQPQTAYDVNHIVAAIRDTSAQRLPARRCVRTRTSNDH